MSRPDLPGWTCPAFDRLVEVVERYVPEPTRTEALITIESLRVSHVTLRHVASGSETPRAQQRVAAEVARLDERIAALAAGRTT